MTDIFISYKKEDAGRVIRVVEALRAEGLSVWWDHGIRAGSEWDKTIHQELYAANVVIAIWSQASVAAPWVKEEATVGKNRGILLPVKIDEVDPPLGFMMIQAADLVGWKGDREDPRWTHFLDAVHSILRNEAPSLRDAPLKAKPKPAGLAKPLIAGGAVLAVLLIGALFVPGFLRERAPVAPIAPTAPVTAPPSAPAPVPPSAAPPAPQPSAPAEPKPSVPEPTPPSATPAPPAPPAPPPITEAEQKLWDRAQDEKTRQAFQTYLIAYPNGAYAQRARDILLTCHTEKRDTWKAEGAPNQISRGVGDTSKGLSQDQACAKAKSDAHEQATSTCETIASNGGFRNPQLKFTDSSCICNKTSPRVTVCVADVPYSCRWEMKVPEQVETCG